MDSKDLSKEEIIYDIDGEIIDIFGKKFVNKNKNICKMIIDNKEYEIVEQFNVKDYNHTKLKIELKGIDNVTDMSYMFSGCSSLSSSSNISKWNTNKVTNMSYMFSGCALLLSLPDISN